MSKKARFWLLIGGGVALAVVVVLLVLFVAVRQQPSFYREALNADRESLEKGSDRLLQQATALVGAARKPGDWEVLFTADEINGWLAVDMQKNHPDVLPPSLHDPRVILHSNGVTLACQRDESPVNTVLSVTFELTMPVPGAISVRFIKARAGLLPVPLKQVLDWFNQIAQEMKWKVEWRHVRGDPVAVVSFSMEDSDQPIELTRLRLGEGEILVAGTTSAKEPEPDAR